MTAVPSQDHLTCGGFDAWIVVNGAKATAYDIQRGEEEQVNCWISSATDRVRGDFDLVPQNLHPQYFIHSFASIIRSSLSLFVGRRRKNMTILQRSSWTDIWRPGIYIGNSSMTQMA